MSPSGEHHRLTVFHLRDHVAYPRTETREIKRFRQARETKIWRLARTSCQAGSMAYLCLFIMLDAARPEKLESLVAAPSLGIATMTTTTSATKTSAPPANQNTNTVKPLLLTATPRVLRAPPPRVSSCRHARATPPRVIHGDAFLGQGSERARRAQ